VRRILRNRRTGQYYGKGVWTDNWSLAENFPNTQTALCVVIDQRLHDVELILQFGKEPSKVYDVCMPLFPESEPSEPKPPSRGSL